MSIDRHDAGRRPLDLALVVVLAGTGLRIWRWAEGWPLWLDEEMISMNLRGRGYAELTGRLGDNQSAPLGWLWLQRLVVDLFGTGERVLRLVPLLFGIGVLVVAWLVGRRFMGPVGTVALVGFCAVNEAFVRYSTEVKQYSADAFWVLVLLGVAGWVVGRPSPRRAAAWWALAAVGSWFSMGAILAVPGLALVLVGTAWWRRRWAFARDVSLPGIAWLASFAVQYQLSLRFTAGSDYLTNFWAGLGYPPRSGPLATVRWLLHVPASLAGDPLHLNAGLPGNLAPKIASGLFWSLVAAGLVVAARRRPAYALLLAAPVASGLALAVLRVVPLAVRLALWLVPALFAAAAVAVDAAARLLVSARRPALGPRLRLAGQAGSGRSGFSGPAGRPPQAAGSAEPLAAVTRSWSYGRLVSRRRAAAAGVVAVGCVVPLAALVPFGASAVKSTATRPAVDDRAAVSWMQTVHRPGDLVLAVGSATRALQWYDPDRRLRPWRMALSKPRGSGCDPTALLSTTARYRRVITYSGIRAVAYKDAPQVLTRRLGEIGTVAQRRTFGGGESVVYVVDLHKPAPAPARGGGCVVAR